MPAMLALLAALGVGACRKADSQQHEQKGPLVTAVQPPLPENPELGKRSEAQSRTHLQHEDFERQAAFDKPRSAQHRAAMRQLSSARTLLDEAKGAQELAEAQRAVRAQLTEVRAKIKEIDPWSNSSRLLPDYDALLQLLETRYPSARIAAYGGNGEPLSAARTQFDAHLREMNNWLARIARE